MNRINHALIFTDRNKCTTQTSHIGRCHNTTFFHLVVQHGKGCRCSRSTYPLKSDLLQNLCNTVPYCRSWCKGKIHNTKRDSQSCRSFSCHKLTHSRDFECGLLDCLTKVLKSFSTHFFQCLLNYTWSADSYIDNCICLCHSKECTRHKRIIIRCITENHQLCTSKGIIILCGFCRFFYDLTTESYRIHIDPGFRRSNIYGTTDPFCLSQCLRNGTDQILFTLRHPF